MQKTKLILILKMTWKLFIFLEISYYRVSKFSSAADYKAKI